ncbi:MAG: LemA family protein, partial [Patescibacteria group bacterium]
MRIEIILIILIVLVVLAVLLVPWIIKTYNKLVWGRNKVKEIWANIEVQLNRRHELVPNLVSTVKGYAKHEDKVLNEVTEARSKATDASTPAEKAASEQQLMMGLSSLYAVAENYPELKANDNFMKLQGELSSI